MGWNKPDSRFIKRPVFPHAICPVPVLIDFGYQLD